MYSTSYFKPRPRLTKSSSASPLKANQGLGISSLHAAAKSQVDATSPKPKSKSKPISNRRKASKHPLEPELPEIRLTPLSPTNGSFPPEIPYPPSPTLARRHSFNLFPGLSMVMDIPLPEQTEEEIQSISRLSSLTNDIEHVRFAGGQNSSTAATAGDSRLSKQSGSSTATEEVDITDIPTSPMTAMEQEEATNGEGIGAFGREPLQVNGGVALLEDSVENHVPDIMTQY